MVGGGVGSGESETAGLHAAVTADSRFAAEP